MYVCIFPPEIMYMYVCTHTYFPKHPQMVFQKASVAQRCACQTQLLRDLLSDLFFVTRGTAKAPSSGRREASEGRGRATCEILQLLEIKDSVKDSTLFSAPRPIVQRNCLKAQVSQGPLVQKVRLTLFPTSSFASSACNNVLH